MFEIIVSFWSVCVCFSMRLFLLKVVMEFLSSRCENVMEVVCGFFLVSLVVIPFFLSILV